MCGGPHSVRVSGMRWAAVTVCSRTLRLGCVLSARLTAGRVACLGVLNPVQDNLLYTLTVQCPKSRWEDDGEVLKQAAASLRLKPSGGSRQYPGSLS
jgi:hypothetical protein